MKRWDWMTWATLAAVAFGAALFVPGSWRRSEYTEATGLPPGVERFVDTEAGVVCWRGGGNSFGATMSCLPIERTRLGVAETAP